MEELFKRVLGNDRDKGGIYKITNIKNQKVYIGKTTKFIDRWRTHAKRGCGIERIKGQLYDAMFEDGLENYTWEIVEVCDKDKQTSLEKYWILFYKSDQWGYNMKVG
jgi:group I intron endonuclease